LSAAKLHNFCAVNFFVFPDTPPPDGDYKYCLAPDLNIDRGMSVYDGEKAQQYEALAKQLAVLVSEAQISFDGFLKVLKKYGVLVQGTGQLVSNIDATEPLTQA
jgi:hypothetical protein